MLFSKFKPGMMPGFFSNENAECGLRVYGLKKIAMNLTYLVD